MSVRDWFSEILETCFRLFPVPVRTGLRRIGNPGRASPVFLTGNYHLTVRRVMRAMRGLDAYLVVANSRGINVWCASSGGLLGTHQVVTALKLAGLENQVVHREAILPQLAATGVEGREVRRRTGWIVRFGPTDAGDIPAYLEAGKQKTPSMRQVRFDLRDRLEMAVVWAAPISFFGGLIIGGIFGLELLPGIVALAWGLALLAFLVVDRMPLQDLGVQILMALAGLGSVIVALAVTGGLTLSAATGWSLLALGVVALLTFDLRGATPTARSVLFEEKAFQIALDRDRCKGAYNCWEVCPEGVFDKQIELHKISLAHDDRCIRCGACIVQCPQDALAFERSDGGRIGPETIRRFKLNMLGRRVAEVPAPPGESAPPPA